MRDHVRARSVCRAGHRRAAPVHTRALTVPSPATSDKASTARPRHSGQNVLISERPCNDFPAPRVVPTMAAYPRVGRSPAQAEIEPPAQGRQLTRQMRMLGLVGPTLVRWNTSSPDDPHLAHRRRGSKFVISYLLPGAEAHPEIVPVGRRRFRPGLFNHNHNKNLGQKVLHPLSAPRSRAPDLKVGPIRSPHRAP